MGGLITSLSERLKRLLKKSDSESHADAEAIADTKVSWESDIGLSMGALAQETETKASGRVQIISLAEFRDSIGPLWDDYKDRILLIAESTIARMIGKGNTFIAQDDDTWLLLFTRSKEDEAIERANAIAKSLGEKLVGARFTEEEPPLPEAAKLDISGVFNADGSFNLQAMRGAVSRARTLQRRPALTAKPAPPPPPPEEVRDARRHARMAARSIAEELKILFRPAWSADTQSLDSLFFRAFTATGENVYDDFALNEATALDLVQLAARAFTLICAAGTRLKYSLPVPYTLIDGPDLPTLQRIIAAIRQQDRLLQLRIEITHIPQRARAEDLVRARELLRGYVRDVAFMLDPFALNEQATALDHVVIGADLSRDLHRDDDELRAAMILLKQRAGKRSTYMLGLRSRTQLAYALHAGIDEVGGPILSDDLKRPPERIIIIQRGDMLRT